jgi:hypothetical protein
MKTEPNQALQTISCSVTVAAEPLCVPPHEMSDLKRWANMRKISLFLCVVLLTGSCASPPLKNELRGKFVTEDLSIINYRTASYIRGGSYIYYYTATKAELIRQVDWNGLSPLPLPLSELVKKATSLAQKVRTTLAFEGLRIESCYDSPEKKYAVVVFTDEEASDMDLYQREIYLLLDGTPVLATRRDITEIESMKIWEHGLSRSSNKE